MKIKNVTQLEDFLKAVSSCEGGVRLISTQGDQFNLKSDLSKYIAIGALLDKHGEELELFCDIKADEQYFMKFFRDHPEVN